MTEIVFSESAEKKILLISFAYARLRRFLSVPIRRLFSLHRYIDN